MVKILEDGTKKTYYTECPKCGSHISYEYEDVTVKETKIEFLNQFLVSKTIRCPKCDFGILSLMQTEQEYKKARTGYTGFDPCAMGDKNQCCCK